MEQATRRLIIDRLRHLMRVNPDVDTIKKLAERSGPVTTGATDEEEVVAP